MAQAGMLAPLANKLRQTYYCRSWQVTSWFTNPRQTTPITNRQVWQT